MAIPVLLFAGAAAVTEPPFYGDTEVYAHQVEQVRAGILPATALWEFGHILWRPAGYVLAPVFFTAVPDGAAWNRKTKIIYGLKWINLLCAAAAALMIYDLGRRILLRPGLALLPVLLFVSGDAVLAYSQTGSSYVVALGFLIAGIWWQMVCREFTLVNIVGPGILLGLAACFWFPFVLAVPAAACSRKLIPLRDAKRTVIEWRQVFVIAGVATGVVMAVTLTGAVLGGVGSLHDFLAWAGSSRHEWSQNRRWVRAISGCSRLLIDLGSDGVSLKRFVFKDPYNPMGFFALVRDSLWKIAIFYGFAGCVGLLAWGTAQSRRTLGLLLTALLPTLIFAVFLFEPSSPERFLPVLPFLLLALCAGWDSPGRTAPILRAAVIAFAIVLPAINWPTFAGSFSPEIRRVHTQIADFRAHAQPRDVLVAVSAYEPLFEALVNPLDPIRRPGDISAHALINVSGSEATQWRSRFARLALDSWREGREVWIVKSAMADRPESRSLWVEGDNPAVHWPDVPQFLRTLEFDGQTPSADGFVKLRRSAAVLERLDGLIPNGETGGRR
jgi:hypothetical protein